VFTFGDFLITPESTYLIIDNSAGFGEKPDFLRDLCLSQKLNFIGLELIFPPFKEFLITLTLPRKKELQIRILPTFKELLKIEKPGGRICYIKKQS
jgi:hypothetical protein